MFHFFCSGHYELCEDLSMHLIVFHRKKKVNTGLLQVNDDRMFLGEHKRTNNGIKKTNKNNNQQ